MNVCVLLYLLIMRRCLLNLVLVALFNLVVIKFERQMAELVRSTSKPHHRRRSSVSDIDAEITHLEKGRYRPCCFACSVGACVCIFTLIIIFSIICIAYIALLKAWRPQVNVSRLYLNNAAMNLEVRVSNKNEKLSLLYGPLTVDVFTNKENVKLGSTGVEGFSHKPQNDTNLDMTISFLENAKADTHIVDQLNTNSYEMLVDVYLRGYFGMKVGSLQVTIVPFLSSCREMKQKDVDNKKNNDCDFKIFSFSCTLFAAGLQIIDQINYKQAIAKKHLIESFIGGQVYVGTEQGLCNRQ
ncbi:hypothetical protein RIF29_17266 [Crotalaria pallida]|uniref:Late embryogenesis abundant protein LEA-2 subgroup domain-containing protein n=1 Tax=Crotalaria pallida TaxID=3830 RepID=A0AAN9FNR5_CROPI